MERLIAPL